MRFRLSVALVSGSLGVRGNCYKRLKIKIKGKKREKREKRRKKKVRQLAGSKDCPG